jgi:hypothetical protein
MTGAAASPLQIFCEKFGVGSPFDTERIRAGRNSEVLLLSNPHGEWILKKYYVHAGDKRDRLGTEFNFLMFLRDSGIAGVPRPLGADHGLACGLYSFLPGRRPGVIESGYIGQAADFVRKINQHGQADNAQRLPKAADACLNWKEHLDLAESRIGQLLAATPTAQLELDAQAFVRDRLLTYWVELKSEILRKLPAGGLAASSPLESKCQIISPSDFGFHNALEHNGRLSFVDFEYAGWDDPAKLICDFICQPDLPVSASQGRQFRDELVRDLPDAESVRQRVECFLPAHRLKWCCILLNEFKLEARSRRSRAGVEMEGLLARQLDKAKHYFNTHLASTH